MKYNYKIYEVRTNAVVLEGTTSGRGTRKDQEADVRIIAMLSGINTLLTNKYKISLKGVSNHENGCQYCKYKFRSDEDEPCVICSHNYTDKFKDDGTREVNADE